MLKNLHIEDFVLIDRVTLELGAGFTVLTGETGAGKSIIVTALELLLGGRGDALLVRRGAQRARLEAVFDIGAAAARALAAEEVAAEDGEVILRREIGADGRSRCYANGRPVTVATLVGVAGALVELHGQFSELPALRGRGQTDLLDDFAGLAAERADYEDAWRRWRDLVAERARLEETRAERAVVLDGLAFMVAELEGANLVAGEEEDLRGKRGRLQYAARVAADVEGALALLSEDEAAVAVRLGSLRRLVADLAEVLPGARATLARLDESAAALDDVARDLVAMRAADDDASFSLDELEARLAELERLNRKYDRDEAGLIAHLEEVRAKRDALAAADDRIADVEAALAEAAVVAAERAGKLTIARAGAAAELAREVNGAAGALGLEGARFDVAFGPPAAATPAGEAGTPLASTGAEEATFMFAANPGEPLKPLAKAASGGELSRVMLAVRAASAGRAGADTIVFDEVDAGIGGRVGHAVGKRLRDVAVERQVICVTHLAQIAARARWQFFVDKKVREGRARVSVGAVAGDARRDELARMLGGGKPPTPTTLKHADELLAAAAAEEAAPARRGKVK